jgi:NADH-quinone oxidoreductase subunit N
MNPSLGLVSSREIQLINQMAGLWRQSQSLALALSISLFSLAGIPPLSGFFAKLFAINAILNVGYYPIAIIAILSSVLSAANYLHIVKVTHFDHPL